ncbi:hypothetical protein DBA20_18265 [Pandoraea capi]|nr:hypothetical protein [Pandoraea sp. LA3]MDN4584923.1 hypothetical protein [Pandoraea capi]
MMGSVGAIVERGIASKRMAHRATFPATRSQYRAGSNNLLIYMVLFVMWHKLERLLLHQVLQFRNVHRRINVEALHAPCKYAGILRLPEYCI